jgi:ribosomal protein L40E
VPHVVFDEDLSEIEQRVAEIKNVVHEMLKTLTIELSNIENTVKQIRGGEQNRPHGKLKIEVQSVELVVCKSCGEKNPADGIYCTECGKKLAYASPARK